MIVWIPIFNESEDNLEHSSGSKKEYVPWIVCPSGGDPRLEEHDPYATPCANLRPRLANDLNALFLLTSDDPFLRIWQDKHGRPVVRAQAWGHEDRYTEDGPHSGLRLICTSSILKKILVKDNKDLLLLINLERYEKESYRGSGKWTHSIGVAQITKTLSLEYFKGRTNYLHKSNY